MRYNNYMNNHAPSRYACPICRFILWGEESEHNKLDDIVDQRNGTATFISPNAKESPRVSTMNQPVTKTYGISICTSFRAGTKTTYTSIMINHAT